MVYATGRFSLYQAEIREHCGKPWQAFMMKVSDMVFEMFTSVTLNSRGRPWPFMDASWSQNTEKSRENPSEEALHGSERIASIWRQLWFSIYRLSLTVLLRKQCHWGFKYSKSVHHFFSRHLMRNTAVPESWSKTPLIQQRCFNDAQSCVNVSHLLSTFKELYPVFCL